MTGTITDSGKENIDGVDKNFPVALIVFISLGIIWGIITLTNEILIPFLNNVFEHKSTESIVVEFTVFAAGFMGFIIHRVISIQKVNLIEKTAYKNVRTNFSSI